MQIISVKLILTCSRISEQNIETNRKIDDKKLTTNTIPEIC